MNNYYKITESYFSLLVQLVCINTVYSYRPFFVIASILQVVQLIRGVFHLYSLSLLVESHHGTILFFSEVFITEEVDGVGSRGQAIDTTVT
jgi:hypothetical protein